jgi:hypothetical protein
MSQTDRLTPSQSSGQAERKGERMQRHDMRRQGISCTDKAQGLLKSAKSETLVCNDCSARGEHG